MLAAESSNSQSRGQVSVRAQGWRGGGVTGVEMGVGQQGGRGLWLCSLRALSVSTTQPGRGSRETLTRGTVRPQAHRLLSASVSQCASWERSSLLWVLTGLWRTGMAWGPAQHAALPMEKCPLAGPGSQGLLGVLKNWGSHTTDSCFPPLLRGHRGAREGAGGWRRCV